MRLGRKPGWLPDANEVLDAKHDACLLRGFSSGWLRRKASTAEVTEWLRRYYPFNPEVSCRALKPTVLSWAAKAGLPSAARRLLGYHVKPKDKITILYSRDELAGPLRLVQDLYLQIRAGSFLPDASRSGRWAQAPEARGRSRSPRATATESRSSSSSSEPSSSVSGSSAAMPASESPTALLPGVLILNVATHKVHIEDGDGVRCGKKTSCTRVITSLPAHPRLCRLCWRDEC